MPSLLLRVSVVVNSPTYLDGKVKYAKYSWNHFSPKKKIVYIQKTDLNAERGTYLIVVIKKFQKSIDFS